MSELKCCKLCGAFLTCDHKGECCPECTYFDQDDNICLAPDSLKKAKKSKPNTTQEIEPIVEEVDPETFLFEDDDEEEEDDLFDEDDEELGFTDLPDDDW